MKPGIKNRRLLCILFVILLFILLIPAAYFGKKLYVKTVAKDEWRVTQYGPRDVNSEFYTLYNPKKGLIVVDGGWIDDAEYVRGVIKAQGGVVDAWILTHPHQDHIGAFTAIWPNPQGIKIKNIYTVDMASPQDCHSVASWDSIEAYEAFLALNVPDLNYVQAGDVLELLGLKVEIYNAFGDYTRELSKDYLNDGSMMFKVTNQEESFLFCADVGISVSDYLLEKWGNNLKADYIQMGHHGNGGLDDDFYETVSPKAAFFDAPDWLMYDETGKYDTPENSALMESLGSEVLSFNSAPNSLILN